MKLTVATPDVMNIFHNISGMIAKLRSKNASKIPGKITHIWSIINLHKFGAIVLDVNSKSYRHPLNLSIRLSPQCCNKWHTVPSIAWQLFCSDCSGLSHNIVCTMPTWWSICVTLWKMTTNDKWQIHKRQQVSKNVSML